jgi:hypothetical protein
MLYRRLLLLMPPPPARQVGDPHSVETGSIEGDLTARMTHIHPLYKVDNGLVYNMIESVVMLRQPSLHSVVNGMDVKLFLL